MGVFVLVLVSALSVTPDQLKWTAFSEKGWPPGSATAIVAGDPAKPCGWVMRYRMPDGFRVPVHTNTDVEAATVLTGTYAQGIGPVAGRALARKYPTGSHLRADRGVPHFGYAIGPTILEVRPICKGR